MRSGSAIRIADIYSIIAVHVESRRVVRVTYRQSRLASLEKRPPGSDVILLKFMTLENHSRCKSQVGECSLARDPEWLKEQER